VPLELQELLARRVPLELQELLEALAPRGQLVPLDRRGRKVPQDLLDQVEGLTAGKSFRAAAISSCRLESAT
jgi:hypothetical protein